ncbi:MAG TPA: Mur ligase domain-containing protein [Elusimicrobiales bacterium]|nr:Mur ligase domain-containing protein [Elusimicrobiales bacterium]
MEKGVFHFTGIGGFGMSALAQMRAMTGLPATGSDRDFDAGRNPEARAALEKLGIRIFPQDGSGVKGAAKVVASTAVENSNPDLARAAALGVPVIHRSELLAEHVNSARAVAVAGTSGKSTVAAMIFEILTHAGLSPSIITGGALLSLKEKGLLGNAFAGSSGLLVVEADESDGTVARYRPALGLLLNITRDHKEVEELRGIFSAFAANCGEFLSCADDTEASAIGPAAGSFGRSAPGPAFSAPRPGLFESGFRLGGVEFSVPAPGDYNIDNAVAAAAACARLGVDLKICAAALKDFRGVARRFNVLGRAGGVTVIDDFAHNPAKIAAVLSALKLREGGRVLAVFQPHGFAPARLMRGELPGVLASSLSPDDEVFFPDIYYAGGTVARDISSADLAADAAAAGLKARHLPDRGRIAAEVAAAARPGDIIIVMGARDPGLPALARDILAEVSGRANDKI